MSKLTAVMSISTACVPCFSLRYTQLIDWKQEKRMSDRQHLSLPEQRPKREAMLCLRLTRQEQRRIYDFAKRHNVQVSKLVRHFVLKAIQHHTERREDEAG